MSRDRPACTPPSASASITTMTNAGPLPESPVTASMCFSSTTTVRPTASKSERATSRSALVAVGVAESAVTPAPTRAGVLGMARTRRVPAGSTFSQARGPDAGSHRNDQALRGDESPTLIQYSWK